MMLRSMLTASTALNQLQQQMDTVSSNLSNSDTTGYKARDSRFSELIRQQYDHIDDKKENSPDMRKTPPGLRLGAGTVMTPQLDSGQGSIKKPTVTLISRSHHLINIFRQKRTDGGCIQGTAHFPSSRQAEMTGCFS